MKRSFVAAIIALFAISGIVSAAPNKYSIQIEPSNPTFGDEIVISATGQPDYSFVRIKCYQNNQFVLDAFRGVTETAYSFGKPLLMANFSNGGLWTSGEADCIADLGYWPNGRWKSLTKLEFHVTE